MNLPGWIWAALAAVPDDGLERALDEQPIDVFHGEKVQVLRLKPRQPAAAEETPEAALRIGDLDEQRRAWLVRAAVAKTRKARWVELPDDL